jgi:hypothetical protein
LKTGFDHEKCTIYGALRAFCPLSHFIFYLIVIKNNKNIYIIEKKSGFLTKAEKWSK